MAEKNNIRIKIFIDGSWTDFMPLEECRKYQFTECVIEERMTRAEYNKLYVKLNVPKL